MASRTATVVGFRVLSGDQNAVPAETTGALKTGVISLWNNTSSTVDGASDTLDVALLGAVIASNMGTGKTCTVRSVGLYGSAFVASTSYGATVAMSTTTLQVTPKSVTDYSTAATLPANTSTTHRYYEIFVAWSEA